VVEALQPNTYDNNTAAAAVSSLGSITDPVLERRKASSAIAKEGIKGAFTVGACVLDDLLTVDSAFRNLRV
jgi:hypothetical protein